MGRGDTDDFMATTSSIHWYGRQQSLSTGGCFRNPGQKGLYLVKSATVGSGIQIHFESGAAMDQM